LGKRLARSAHARFSLMGSEFHCDSKGSRTLRCAALSSDQSG
jgi:hypothetical protein